MNSSLSVAIRAVPGAVLHAFTHEPNGCSYSPDFDWRLCCDEHDLDYYKGGGFWDKTKADARLAKCITRKGRGFWGTVAHGFAGGVYFGAVTAGGLFFWNWGGRQIDKAALHEAYYKETFRRGGIFPRLGRYTMSRFWRRRATDFRGCC